MTWRFRQHVATKHHIIMSVKILFFLLSGIFCCLFFSKDDLGSLVSLVSSCSWSMPSWTRTHEHCYDQRMKDLTKSMKRLMSRTIFFVQNLRFRIISLISLFMLLANCFMDMKPWTLLWSTHESLDKSMKDLTKSMKRLMRLMSLMYRNFFSCRMYQNCVSFQSLKR